MVAPKKAKKTPRKKVASPNESTPARAKQKQVSKKTTTKKEPRSVLTRTVAQKPKQGSSSVRTVPSPYQDSLQNQERLTLKSRHIATKRALISLFQFDRDEVAILVARYGGVAIVLLGGFLTLWSYQSDSLTPASQTAQLPVVDSEVASPVTTDFAFIISDIEPFTTVTDISVRVDAPYTPTALTLLMTTPYGQTLSLGEFSTGDDRLYQYPWDVTGLPVGQYQLTVAAEVNKQVFFVTAPKQYQVGAVSVPTSESEIEMSPQSIEDPAVVGDTEITNLSTSSEMVPSAITADEIEILVPDASGVSANQVSDVPPVPEVTVEDETYSRFQLLSFDASESETVTLDVRREGSVDVLESVSLRNSRGGDVVYLIDTAKWPNGLYSVDATISALDTTVAITRAQFSIDEPTSTLSEIPNLTTTYPTTPEEIDATLEGVPYIDYLMRFSERQQLADGDTTWLPEFVAAFAPGVFRFELAVATGVNTQTLANLVDTLMREVASLSDSPEIMSLKQRALAAMLYSALSSASADPETKQDEDSDGLLDQYERGVLGTAANSSDTDRDGYTDTAEVLGGYDPRANLLEVPLVLQSPEQFGAYDDTFRVTNVATIYATDERKVSSTGLYLTGEAMPHGFLSVFVPEADITGVVRTDETGRFVFIADRQLPDGEYTAYVAGIDNAGRILQKSEPYAFIVSDNGNAAPQKLSVDPGSLALYSDVGQRDYYTEASLALVAIGLVLLLLAHYLRELRRPIQEVVRRA